MTHAIITVVRARTDGTARARSQGAHLVNEGVISPQPARALGSGPMPRGWDTRIVSCGEKDRRQREGPHRARALLPEPEAAPPTSKAEARTPRARRRARAGARGPTPATPGASERAARLAAGAAGRLAQ